MIPLLIAGNEKVADGLLIDLISYAQCAKEPAEVFFLTMDYRELDPSFAPLAERQGEYLDSYLKEKVPGSAFHLIDAKKAFEERFDVKDFAKSIYTPYTLLRLAADRVEGLPDALLYVDTDIMFLQDVKEAYAKALSELGDNEYLAVKDRVISHFHKGYINAGVMLLNLKAIRESGLFDACCDYLEKKRPTLMDQTALNACAKKKGFLDPAWNVQKEQKGTPLIRHFAICLKMLPFPHNQKVKPWQVERVRSKLHNPAYEPILTEYLSRKEEFEALGQ